jgi:hypothetical protein
MPALKTLAYRAGNFDPPVQRPIDVMSVYAMA